jgi:hypothetical protein
MEPFFVRTNQHLVLFLDNLVPDTFARRLSCLVVRI